MGNLMIQVQKVLYLQPPQTSKMNSEKFAPESHDGSPDDDPVLLGMFQNLSGANLLVQLPAVYHFFLPESPLGISILWVFFV